MRALKFNDVYKMSRILKKIKISEEINLEGKSQTEAGVELVMGILENMDKAQNEINEFLGELTGMTGEEFGDLPPTEFLKHIEEFKNQPGIEAFFNAAGKLMK